MSSCPVKINIACSSVVLNRFIKMCLLWKSKRMYTRINNFPRIRLLYCKLWHTHRLHMIYVIVVYYTCIGVHDDMLLLYHIFVNSSATLIQHVKTAGVKLDSYKEGNERCIYLVLRYI